MRKAMGKMMAMILSASLMATPLTTVSVYAAETDLTELKESDAEDFSALSEEGDTTVYVSDDSLTDNFGTNTDLDASSDVSETGEDTKSEEGDASYDTAGRGAGVSKDSLKVFKKIAGGKNSYMYKKLSAKQKKLYNSIDKEVTRILKGGKLYKEDGDVITKVVYKGVYDQDLFDTVMEIYRLDNPQAFFLDRYEAKFKTYKNVRMYIQISKDANTTKKIKKIGNAIAKNLKAASAQVKKGKNGYQKAVNATQLLCERLKRGGNTNRGLMAVFYKNKGTGGGTDYAIGFTALARLSGLEVYQVPGDGFTDWNRVKVNKKFYNVDVYYADWKDDLNVGVDFNPDYFLKNDRTINKDSYHVINSDYKKYLPKTNSTDYPLPAAAN